MQCDQMDWSLCQYLAIYNNENLSKTLSNLPKKVQNFAQILTELFQNGQSFLTSYKSGKNVAKSGHTDWELKTGEKTKRSDRIGDGQIDARKWI